MNGRVYNSPGFDVWLSKQIADSQDLVRKSEDLIRRVDKHLAILKLRAPARREKAITDEKVSDPDRFTERL